MTTYALRNGLSIDLTFDTPTLLNPAPATFDYEPQAAWKAKLDAYPFPIDDQGHVIKSLNVMKMKATGVLSGASADVFAKCALRFIQLIKVSTFTVQYFGKRKDEGSITWSWQGPILQRNIDCWVSPDGSQDSSPFQFTVDQSEHTAPNTLVGKLGDTPGARIPLLEKNEKTGADNYLRSFLDRRSFESIITFVHADGSLQMLESWKWSFTRSVAVKWEKLKPAIDGPNRINFLKDPALTSVFGKDIDFDSTLKSGRIANRLTREAMQNYRSSPNVSFAELKESNIEPPERFWSP